MLIDTRYKDWGWKPANPWECNYTEVGLLDCGYGCKVMRCQHGQVKESHRRIYGCPLGK